MSGSIVIATSLLTLVLACSSFAVRSPLGSFKPVPLMLIIFSSYNVLPFLVVSTTPELAEVLLRDTFSHYSASNMLAVVGLALACVIAGLLGLIIASHAASLWRTTTRRIQQIESNHLQARRLAFGVAIYTLIMIVISLLLWTLREFLFAGYHEAFGNDQNEVLLRGSLSSLFTLLFVSYLFTWFANEFPAIPLRRRRILFWSMTLGLLFVGLALLSMGGRLYCVSAVVTMIALRAMQSSMRARKSVSSWKLLGLVGLLIGAVASIGIWRTQSDFNVLAVIINLLAEPVFVSISLVSLFGANDVPAIAFPSLLLGDAVGVLPSAIYPEKLERLFAISGVYQVESPVGGLSGLASLSANFGWLGAIVVFGLICFVVARLSFFVARPQTLSPLRVVYVVAVTFPLLSLCRDPFVISVYKNLMQNSLLWPLALTLAGQMVLVRRLAPRGLATPATPLMH